MAWSAVPASAPEAEAVAGTAALSPAGTASGQPPAGGTATERHHGAAGMVSVSVGS